MLEWTTAGDGALFGGIVHHTDGEREWAYGRESYIGKLDKGLNEAAERNWVIIDIKEDRNKIFK